MNKVRFRLGIPGLILLAACAQGVSTAPSTVSAPTAAPLATATTLPTAIPTAFATTVPTAVPTAIGTSPGETAVCSLLTQGEAGVVLGEPVGRPRFQTLMSGELNISTCAYVSLVANKFVEIGLYVPGSSPSVTNQFFQATKSRVSRDRDFQVIEGLADEAFWDGLHLFARKQDTVFTTFAGRIEESNLEKAKRLAEIVLKRLP